MSAFRSVRSRQPVDKFCAIGSNLLNGPVSLVVSRWETALDDMERALKDTSILPPLSSIPSSCVREAQRHYHALYSRCAELIPISPTRWQQWQEGLQFFAASNSSLGPQCLDWQRRRFAIAFWGSWSSLCVRLESLLVRISTMNTESSLAAQDAEHDGNESANVENSDTDTNSDEMDNNGEAKRVGGGTEVDRAIVRLRRRFGAVLSEFECLARDAAHLYGHYAFIGHSERRWLIDTLLESEEAATEVLIRRSFKRDVGVPSVELNNGALLEEYAEFEVNETKARLVRKRAQETLRGDWQKKSCAMYEKEQQRRQELEKPEIHSEVMVASDSNPWELTDALTASLSRQAGAPEVALAAFMRQVIESPIAEEALDAARLRNGLYFIGKWFEQQCDGRRRRSNAPRLAPSPLWDFVLERHTELLKWALLSHVRQGDGFGALQLVLAVGLSAARCLQLYQHARHTGVSEEQRRLATGAVSHWIESVLIANFLEGAVQSGRHDDHAEESSNQTHTLLVMESAIVKTYLWFACGAPSAAMDARRVLLPAVATTVSNMRSWNTPSDSTALWSILSALRALRRTWHPGVDETDELLFELNAHYESLWRYTTTTMSECVRWEWIDFLTGDGKRLLSNRRISLLNASFGQRTQSGKEKKEEDPLEGDTQKNETKCRKRQRGEESL